MEQVRGGVIAHGGFAELGVDHGIELVTHTNRLLGDDLVRTYALDWVVNAGHFGNDRVVVVGVKPAMVADLAASFGIERRLIEYDLALLAGLQFLYAVAVLE